MKFHVHSVSLTSDPQHRLTSREAAARRSAPRRLSHLHPSRFKTPAAQGFIFSIISLQTDRNSKHVLHVILSQGQNFYPHEKEVLHSSSKHPGFILDAYIVLICTQELKYSKKKKKKSLLSVSHSSPK